MNYKELFNKMAFLLSSPSRFWEKEATEGQGSRMMSEYVYPLIGLCGLSEFIGTFIGRDVSTEFFQWALTRCCAIAVSLFGGFFVATYLLDKIIRWAAEFLSTVIPDPDPEYVEKTENYV